MRRCEKCYFEHDRRIDFHHVNGKKICDNCAESLNIPIPPCIDWQDLIARISLTDFPLRVSVEYYKEGDADRAFIYCTVPHRETGIEVRVGNHYVLPHISKKYRAIEYIRDTIKGLVIHELDEFFTYNSKRVFDPHKRYTP